MNAIRFAIPLLKGEVNVVDQLLLEALRSTFPNLYLSIRANEGTYLGSDLDGLGDKEKQKEAARQIVDAGLLGLSNDERTGATYLLETLFPRVKSVIGKTSYGSDFDEIWASERRLPSDAYFRRYFQYSIPLRDIADAEVRRLVEAVGDGRPHDRRGQFAFECR